MRGEKYNLDHLYNELGYYTVPNIFHIQEYSIRRHTVKVKFKVLPVLFL
jgi:hypothetical protein